MVDMGKITINSAEDWGKVLRGDKIKVWEDT